MAARLSLRATGTRCNQPRSPRPASTTDPYSRDGTSCCIPWQDGILLHGEVGEQSGDRRRPMARGCGLFSLFRAYSRRGHFADDERSPGAAPQKDSCISTRFIAQTVTIIPGLWLSSVAPRWPPGRTPNHHRAQEGSAGPARDTCGDNAMFCHPTIPRTWSVTLPKLDTPAFVLQCLHATSPWRRLRRSGVTLVTCPQKPPWNRSPAHKSS